MNLTEDELDRAFDLERSLANIDAVFDALDDLDGGGRPEVQR